MRYQDYITLTRILQGKIFQGFDFLYGKFLHFVKAANIQPNKALSFPRFKSGIRIFLQIKPPAKKIGGDSAGPRHFPMFRNIFWKPQAALPFPRPVFFM